VDGVLAAFFAILIVIVLLDAVRIWAKALRSHEPMALNETPYERSRLVAPAGLFPTAEERSAMAEAGRAPAHAGRDGGNGWPGEGGP
jgi:carbon starvation protein